jgi:uncharacterized repeat protein (TIGR01451 family)
LTFVSATPSQGTYSSTSGAWTVGTVTTTTPQTLSIQARLAAPAAQTNTATVSHSDQFDPITPNNTDSAIATPQEADLDLTKRVENPTPNVGDTITFTVALSNLGPDPATNVTVEDQLPAGLTFVSADPSQGTYSSTSGAWTVGTVTTTAPQTLSIQARVAAPAAQTNTAAVSHSDQFDPVAANNQATATATPQQSDLALTKTVSSPTPEVGTTITYRITLTNEGPDPATGVEVTDLLPAGLTFVSAALSQGSYDPTTGLWTVGTVSPANPETLAISARVVSFTAVTNTATVSAADQFDPDHANNTASVTATGQGADLAMTKTAAPGPFTVGQEITYTLTATNLGPSSDPGVILVDMLPAGVTFVSASVTPSAQSGTSLTFALGTLAAGQSDTVTLTVRAEEAGTLVNRVNVSGLVADPDPANNTATATTTVTQMLATVESLQRFGYHAQPTELVLRFSEPLDSARAQDVSNYRLTQVTRSGRPVRAVRLTAADYNATAQTVTLHPNQLLPLKFHYQLVVNGTSATGVSDLSGALIDGNGDGVPGGNYVRVFGGEILAGPNRPGSQRGHVLAHLSQPGQARAVRLSGLPAAPQAPVHHSAGMSPASGLAHVVLNPSAVDSALEAIAVPPHGK